jgi:hypothetical protein
MATSHEAVARGTQTPVCNQAQEPGVVDGRLVTRRTGQLRPHPSYARHRLSPSVTQLSSLAEFSNIALAEAVVITHEGLIVDGYARWELARLQGRGTIACIEYALTEEQALHLLLQRHRRSAGLNAYCRILLALDLERSLREQARSNQRTGGLSKGSSNLTEAYRLDVRHEIARVAGVSAGNVTKVKKIRQYCQRRCKNPQSAG